MDATIYLPSEDNTTSCRRYENNISIHITLLICPAIALYRALLSRCSASPLPAEDRTSLQHAIRNKFKQNRKIQSSRQLDILFRAGYEVGSTKIICIDILTTVDS
jgi:hypothetical protein